MNRRKYLKSVGSTTLLPSISYLDTNLTGSCKFVVENSFKKIMREWNHRRKVVYLSYLDGRDDIVSVVYKTPQNLTVYTYTVDSRIEVSRVFNQVQANNFDTDSMEILSKQVIQRDNK